MKLRGYYNQPGHSYTADKLVLILVAQQQLRGAQIVMVAAGGNRSVTLGAEGIVWDKYGQLGTSNERNSLVPTLLDGEVLGGAVAVVMASGNGHTVIVTIEGALWSCRYGRNDWLGLDHEDNSWALTLVGAEAAFGESQVLAVTCGAAHTLAVTKACDLLSFTWEQHFALGHNDNNNRQVQTHIKAAFGNGNIVSTAAGPRHSVAVTEKSIPTLAAGRERWALPQQPATVVCPHLRYGYVCVAGQRCADVSGSRRPQQRRLQRQEGKALDATEKGKDCGYITMPEELV